MEKQAILSEEVMKKWEPVLTAEDVAPVSDPTIRNNLVRLLENQEKANVQESVEIGAGISNWDPILISLVRRTMPNLIANDLIGVQPMSGPTGLIFAMRVEYQGNSADAGATYNTHNTVAAGTEAFGDAGDAASDAPQPIYGGAATGNTLADTTGQWLGRDTQFGEMGFTIEKGSVTAGTRGLKARFTTELAHDLQQIHGLNAETELANILQAELQGEINREIITKINTVAEATTAIQDGPDTNTTLEPGVVYMDQFDGRWELERWKNLYMFIAREAIQVGIRTRRGPANWVLASPTVVAGLQLAGMLDTNAAIRDGVVDVNSATFVGVLGGRFKMYVDPYATTEYFTLGYKGANVYDAGMFYCPYVPLTFMKSIGEEDFQPRIGFKTRYGMVENPYIDIANGTPGTGFAAASNFYYRTCTVNNIGQ